MGGSFRDTYMQRAFCCARRELAPMDPACVTPDCAAYDMFCPGSRLLTSDMDCTVYHSRDPGALILQMIRLMRETFLPLARDESYATLGAVFDANLYGTWTCIPDNIFQRFSWPARSKALFEEVPGKGRLPSVWVLRKKCTSGSQTAISKKLKDVFAW